MGKVREGMSGDALVVASGGVVIVESGGRVDVQSGGTVNVRAGARMDINETRVDTLLDGAVAGAPAAGKVLIADASFASAVGAINAATGLSVTIAKVGSIATLTFTLDAVSIAVTDAAGSGSSGSLKIFDFVQAGIVPLGCRQNYTAFTEGAALTGVAGDAAFVMGLGSAAADAGDGALTGTEVDFGAVTDTITLSEGTGTGTKLNGASSTALDGTGTAVDLYLNWSGTAATIDANSTISVTGTITVVCALLGDD